MAGEQMGFVHIDCNTKLADGKQAAHDRSKIQEFFCKKRYAQTYIAGNWAAICHIFKMAGRSNYFHCLHYFIFGLQKQTHHMTYTAQVKVMPHKELLDPQGKAVLGGLANLGLNGINDVRIGKNITLQVEANSADEAKNIAEEAAKKLLANPVMEMFEVVIG
jgi:phosphoribosylformylglycinamidine synthase subunit PurS